MNQVKIQIFFALAFTMNAGNSFANSNQSRVKPIAKATEKTAEKNAEVETPKAEAKVQEKKKKTLSESTEDLPTLNIENTWESAPKNFGTQKETAKAALSVRVEDIVEPPSEYHYASFGYPDPFVPQIIAEPSIPVATTTRSEVPLISPLQKYALAELKIAGVWLTEDTVWKTLVMTPKGEGIIAKVGDPIANKEGKILGINDEGIRVREYKVNPDGTREIYDSRVMLNPAQDGSSSIVTAKAAISAPEDKLNDAAMEIQKNINNLEMPAKDLAPEEIPSVQERK